MDLVNKFRLDQNSKIALVGSGGKTTLLFELAKAFQTRVICTTTTHMAQDQLGKADHVIEVNQIDDIPEVGWREPGDVILFTGPVVEPNRVKGPNPEQLSKILELSEGWNCPLLIESDGARKLPLKAPAPHEPPIPGFVDAVITVVGLSGVGKPLNEIWVHRPGLFSQLTGLGMGDPILSTHVVEALISDRGGLKNVPPGAKKILMINQVDTFPNWKTLYDQIGLLLSHYHHVAFGVLEDQLLLEVHDQIAGIILAAGGSKRFGEPKQLLDWKGMPLVEHVARIGLRAGLNPVIVITGSNSDKVSSVLSKDVQIVHNPDWQVGQSSSVIAGIESLPVHIGGAVFLLVDQPLIPSDLIHLLVQKHSRTKAAIICPDAGDHPGNPVLFDRVLFEELKQLSGDHGGKTLFKKHNPQFVLWDDPNIQMDIDSQEDYHKLLEISLKEN